MGFWLGFQSPSPFEKIEHHNYPDAAWTVSIRKRGGMTMYSSIDARAIFGENSKYGVIDARDYVEHPGHIAIFARLHLARQEEPPAERIVMNSAEVAALITPARTNQGDK
ncbi:hypothetical protein [Glutamicibacter ardleyensis]|uniref:hypothetical protein n=1 Tax=Glutamicibacter ardleyensis TaxID=225894 RepID=UPI003FD51293